MKNLEFDVKTNEIFGYENSVNDKVFFKKPIKFLGYVDFLDTNYLSELETASKAIIKSKILKTIPMITKANLDYIGIFKLLTSKNTVLQALLMANELLFFHELTCLLKKCEKNEINVEKTLIKFMEKIYISLKSFIEYFRKTLTQNVMKSFYSAFSLFTLQIIKHVNIIEEFLESKVIELACFEYLSLPKFSLSFHKTLLSIDINEVITKTISKNDREKNNNNVVIFSNAADSETFNIYLKHEERPELKIVLISLNYKCNYGYEPVNFLNSHYIFHKMTERVIFHVVSTMVNHSGLYIKGPTHTGKKETFQVKINKNN